MSTVDSPKRKTLAPLVAGQHLDQPTFHQRYEAMPPKTRADLVGGVVYMPSPMRGDHGKSSWIVAGWLFHYSRHTLGIERGDGSTVKLNRNAEPQPDHLLLITAELGGQSSVDDQKYLTGAPELIVEVARSSRSYDLKQTKADYERAGVREYVVVELDPDRIQWFVRRRVRFVHLTPRADRIYRSRVFPGLWLDPEALFAEDLDRLIQVLAMGVATPEHAAFVAKLAKAGAGRKPR